MTAAGNKLQHSKWFFFMVTRQEEKGGYKHLSSVPEPKGQQRRMRIQGLLLREFVFIYRSLMNMNLHLDREVPVPHGFHMEFPSLVFSHCLPLQGGGG